MNLRIERERIGISQAELACRMGVSQPTISKMELGERSISPGEERLIAAALGSEKPVEAPEHNGTVPSEPDAKEPELVAESKHKPRRGRRAYICAKDDCTYRRFLRPDEDIPDCPEHSRMTAQANRRYRGMTP